MISNETVMREDMLPEEAIRAKVLPDTPNALQLGSRCAQQGYGFYWHPFQRKPSFVSPNGTIIECDVDENFIPIIRRFARKVAQRRRPREIQDGSAIATPAAEVQTDPPIFEDYIARAECRVAYSPGPLEPEEEEDGHGASSRF